MRDLLTGQMAFLSPNQQRQSTERHTMPFSKGSAPPSRTATVVLTRPKWVSISRCLCFRLGNVVELRQRTVLSPDLVVVVNRLHRLINVARQCLHSSVHNVIFPISAFTAYYIVGWNSAVGNCRQPVKKSGSSKTPNNSYQKLREDSVVSDVCDGTGAKVERISSTCDEPECFYLFSTMRMML